jgi:hypothetical protein
MEKRGEKKQSHPLLFFPIYPFHHLSFFPNLQTRRVGTAHHRSLSLPIRQILGKVVNGNRAFEIELGVEQIIDAV